MTTEYLSFPAGRFHHFGQTKTLQNFGVGGLNFGQPGSLATSQRKLKITHETLVGRDPVTKSHTPDYFPGRTTSGGKIKEIGAQKKDEVKNNSIPSGQGAIDGGMGG